MINPSIFFPLHYQNKPLHFEHGPKNLHHVLQSSTNIISCNPPNPVSIGVGMEVKGRKELLLPVVADGRGSISGGTGCLTAHAAHVERTVQHVWHGRRAPADRSVMKNCLQREGCEAETPPGSGTSTWLTHRLFCNCRRFARFTFSFGNGENDPCPLCELARAALGSGLCGTSSCWSVLNVSRAQLHQTTTQRQCSSISGTAQRIFKKTTIL